MITVKGLAKGDALERASCNEAYLKITGINVTKGTVTVRTLKKGKTTLKIILKSGKTGSVRFTILPRPTEKIFLPSSSLTLSADKNSSIHIVMLSPILYPKDSDEKVTFTTSDRATVRVTQKGKVTGVKAGSAFITVRSGVASRTLSVRVIK